MIPSVPDPYTPIRAFANRAFNEVEPKTPMRPLRLPSYPTRSDGCAVGDSDGGDESNHLPPSSLVASRAFSQSWLPSAVLVYLDPPDLVRSCPLVCRSFRDATRTVEGRRALLASVFGHFAVTVEYAEKVAELAGGWDDFVRVLTRAAVVLRDLYDPYEPPLVHRALLAENAARRLVRSASPLWATHSYMFSADDEDDDGKNYKALWDTEFATDGQVLPVSFDACFGCRWNGSERHGGVSTSWKLHLGDLRTAQFGRGDVARDRLELSSSYLRRAANRRGVPIELEGCDLFLLEAQRRNKLETWRDICEREGIPLPDALENKVRGAPQHQRSDYAVYERIESCEDLGSLRDTDLIVQVESLSGGFTYESCKVEKGLTISSPDEVSENCIAERLGRGLGFAKRDWDLDSCEAISSQNDLLLLVSKRWRDALLSPSQWEMVRCGTPSPFVLFGVDNSAEPEEYALFVNGDGIQEVGNWSSYYDGRLERDNNKGGSLVWHPFDSSCLSCNGVDWPWHNRGLLSFCCAFHSGGEEMDDGRLLAWCLWSAKHGIEPFASEANADWEGLVSAYEEQEDPHNRRDAERAGVPRRALRFFGEEQKFRSNLLYLRHMLHQKLANPWKYGP